MKLSKLQNHTKPVTVDLGGGEIVTLQVRTQRGTIEGKSQLKAMLHGTNKQMDASGQKLEELEAKRDALLAPIRQLVTERDALIEEGGKDTEAAELRAKILASQKEVRKEVEALNEKMSDCKMEAEIAMQKSLGEQLAFHVASTDVTDEEGKATEATPDFFATNFSITLLEQSLEAVGKALTDPFYPAPDSTEN